jgi:hypothetical protein
MIFGADETHHACFLTKLEFGGQAGAACCAKTVRPDLNSALEKV